jgi:hypothetical protein
MKRSTFRVFALVFGGLALAVSCFGFFRAWTRPTAVEWTPKHYALPATAFSDRLVVYVKGEPLEQALAQGRIAFAGPQAEAAPVAPSDVTVTFNNVHQDRASRMPLLAGLAAIAGAATALILMGLLASGLVSDGGLTELHLVEG